MKKCSTLETTSTFKGRIGASPRATTLAIIRQFARIYRPAPIAGMPGIVLN